MTELMSARSKRVLLESAGILLALFGSATLIFGGLLPLINPEFASINHQGASFSIGNVVVAGIGLGIIYFAVKCSRKAGKLRNDN